MKRSSLIIKKKILEVLKQGEMSLRALESKVNTSYETIRIQVEELEFFGKVVITKHEKSEKNGRPYTTVKLKHAA